MFKYTLNSTRSACTALVAIIKLVGTWCMITNHPTSMKDIKDMDPVLVTSTR